VTEGEKTNYAVILSECEESPGQRLLHSAPLWLLPEGHSHFLLSISCKKWTKEPGPDLQHRVPHPRAWIGPATLLRHCNEGLREKIPLPLGWCIFLPLPLGEVAECSEAGEGFASFALSVSLADACSHLHPEPPLCKGALCLVAQPSSLCRRVAGQSAPQTRLFFQEKQFMGFFSHIGTAIR